MHFSKKLGCRSSTSPEILAFGSHCSANFQRILDCFVPNFKLKYEDSQDIIADSMNRNVFIYIKSNVGRFFWETRLVQFLFIYLTSEPSYASPNLFTLYTLYNRLNHVIVHTVQQAESRD